MCCRSTLRVLTALASTPGTALGAAPPQPGGGEGEGGGVRGPAAVKLCQAGAWSGTKHEALAFSPPVSSPSPSLSPLPSPPSNRYCPPAVSNPPAQLPTPSPPPAPTSPPSLSSSPPPHLLCLRCPRPLQVFTLLRRFRARRPSCRPCRRPDHLPRETRDAFQNDRQ